jgi:hypothetical protein
VFEQKVIHPVPYEISRSVMTELDREGIPIEKIREIAGKRFYNKKVLRNELMKRYNYSNTQIYLIFQYAIIDSFRIDSAALTPAVTEGYLTAAQDSALKRLHGKTFRHKLDFDNALSEHGIDIPVTGNKLIDKENAEHRRVIEQLFRAGGRR